jgi:hypothetical protein
LCGGIVEVWSWSKRRHGSSSRETWTPRVENITVEMFGA